MVVSVVAPFLVPYANDLATLASCSSSSVLTSGCGAGVVKSSMASTQDAADELLADEERGALTPDDLCKNWHVANNYGFVMGVQWLPLPNEGSFHSPHQPGGLDNNHVDWESVMLYDSLHFGTPILLRNDGERFRSNFKLSEGDVHGVKRIYGEREETILEHSFPDLPHQATSGFWGRLREKVDDQMMKAIGCVV
ncbi:hypothetical protein V8F33_010446 [Rhypophila sp. PSN 637]